MAKTKKKEDKEYIVECTITGRASVFVTASSSEEAMELIRNGAVPSADELREWSIDEIKSAEVNE